MAKNKNNAPKSKKKSQKQGNARNATMGANETQTQGSE